LFTVLGLETSFFSNSSNRANTNDTLEEIGSSVERSLELFYDTVTEGLSRDVCENKESSSSNRKNESKSRN